MTLHGNKKDKPYNSFGESTGVNITMAHNNRTLINPPPKLSFKQVFKIIYGQPNNEVDNLTTTGGVYFTVKAKYTQTGKPFISLPHNNRIYECCWGNTSNHMGKTGQRIGQYSRPIDNWCYKKLKYRVNNFGH